MDSQNTVNYFAETNYRNERRKFGIQRDDRRRHMYVIGKTGMGKSTLLENMIIQDIQNGEGLAVVDPHGDLVEKILEYIPSDRINDVVYFNPSDYDNPIAFNILEEVDPQYKHLVSNGLVGVFKKIWADSWGPRLEYILINTILALLEYPGSTLLGVMRMLVDGGFRKKVLKKITDPVVKSFWVNEFNNYTEKFRNEAIAPIQNKVGQFLSSSLIRNIVGQTQSSMDIREIMDGKKILLMNLSKGRIGEENAALLGAMMITKIQLAAMSRVDTPEEQRQDFFLYVDEFQNFATESFAGILSEARKYRLSLIMAHQYIEQLSDEVRAAVFGNVGTMVTFRVGATDAEELEKEYSPTFVQEDIVTLPAYHIYLRLMINGVASDPFSASTLPPLSGKTENRDKVIRVSRERYANPREKVEDAIASWANPSSGQTEAMEARDGKNGKDGKDRKKDDRGNGKGRDKKRDNGRGKDNGKSDQDRGRDRDRDSAKENEKANGKEKNNRKKEDSGAESEQQAPAVATPVPQPAVDFHAMPAPPKRVDPVQVDSAEIPQPMRSADHMRQEVGSAGNSINFVAQLQQKMSPEPVDSEQFSMPVPVPEPDFVPEPSRPAVDEKSSQPEKRKSESEEPKQKREQQKKEKKKKKPVTQPTVSSIGAALPSMPTPVGTGASALQQVKKEENKKAPKVEVAREQSDSEDAIGSLQLPKPLRDKQKRESEAGGAGEKSAADQAPQNEEKSEDTPKKRKRRRKRKRKSGNSGSSTDSQRSNQNVPVNTQSPAQAPKQQVTPSFVQPAVAPPPVQPPVQQPQKPATQAQPIQPGQRIQF